MLLDRKRRDRMMSRVALLDDEVAAQMRGVAGPDARRALMHRPTMAHAIGELNEAVAASQLPLRLHEVVRYRIAQINGCVRCSTYRLPGAAQAGATEDLLEQVSTWRASDRFTGVEREALEFVERFCEQPGSIDDALIDELRDSLGDDGVIDLAVCVAKYVAFGRLITVLQLDQTCSLEAPPELIGPTE
jgi:alkylhydroperoxidase family enzyme